MAPFNDKTYIWIRIIVLILLNVVNANGGPPTPDVTLLTCPADGDISFTIGPHPYADDNSPGEPYFIPTTSVDDYGSDTCSQGSAAPTVVNMGDFNIIFDRAQTACIQTSGNTDTLFLYFPTTLNLLTEDDLIFSISCTSSAGNVVNITSQISVNVASVALTPQEAQNDITTTVGVELVNLDTGFLVNDTIELGTPLMLNYFIDENPHDFYASMLVRDLTFINGADPSNVIPILENGCPVDNPVFESGEEIIDEGQGSDASARTTTTFDAIRFNQEEDEVIIRALITFCGPNSLDHCRRACGSGIARKKRQTNRNVNSPENIEVVGEIRYKIRAAEPTVDRNKVEPSKCNDFSCGISQYVILATVVALASLISFAAIIILVFVLVKKSILPVKSKFPDPLPQKTPI